MNVQEVNRFLEDLTYSSTFRFLEESKDKSILTEIASKRGIILPAHDLAPFECVYAFIGKENKNGCTLPRKEVEASLDTLVGKAIDIDHFRRRVVGYWIDAKIEDDKIIAYGMFFKGNFEDDYETIKELFAEGNLCVSFEAFGDRKFNNGSKDSYTLNNVEFAGGGLLLKTTPAFDGANVLELAKKERVLEMAKTMTKPEYFLHFAEELDLANFTGTDEELNDLIEDKIENSKVISRKDRNALPDDQFALVVTAKNGKKVRMFPVHDPAHVRNALARLPQAAKTLSKLGVSSETVKEKILKRAKELKMDSVVKRHEKSNFDTASYSAYEMDSICRALAEVPNMDGEGKGCFQILMADFQNNKVLVKDMFTEGEMMVDLTPSTTITKKGAPDKATQTIVKITDLSGVKPIENIEEFLKTFSGSDEQLELTIEKSMEGPKVANTARLELTDDDFAVIKTINVAKKMCTACGGSGMIKGDATCGDCNGTGYMPETSSRKIRLFPIIDQAHIKSVEEKLAIASVISTLEKLGITKEMVAGKISKRRSKVTMSNLLEKAKTTSLETVLQELALGSIKRELSSVELENAYSIFEYKAGASPSSNTSLWSIPVQRSTGNPTSVFMANENDFVEDKIKEVIKKVVNETATQDKKIADLTAELAKASAKLAEVEKSHKADLIATRTEELGEEYIAENKISEEVLLDDVKYENAKLKKEVAELKKGSFTPKKLESANTRRLVKGSGKQLEQGSEEASRALVDQYAWGGNGRQTQEDE